MPCRDYGDDNNNWEADRLRERCDELTRYACKAMDLLEELGKEDFLLLEDPELRDWWAQHKADDIAAGNR